MKDGLKQYKQTLKLLKAQRAALADKLAQSPLAKKMARIDAILTQDGFETTPAPRTRRSSSGGTVKETILAALKEGPKTSKQLQQVCKTQFVYIPLTELVRSKEVKTDGKKPATFSLK